MIIRRPNRKSHAPLARAPRLTPPASLGWYKRFKQLAALADNEMFKFSSVIDCSYKSEEHAILVDIIHNGPIDKTAVISSLSPVFPDCEITLNLTGFSSSLYPLYKGKRVIMQE